MCAGNIALRKMRSALWHASRYAKYLRWKVGPVHPGNKHHGLKRPLIVSLTSYPPRFTTLLLTLKCLLSQTVKPDVMVLWIAENDREVLPPAILDLRTYGLTIRFCADLKSYKKIIPALTAYSDNFIVTADDDAFYPRDWLEFLVREYRGDDKEIICHRAYRIRLGANGLPLKYGEWEFPAQTKVRSALIFPTGVGGVLYPPGIFDARVSDAQTFMSLCPTADDIWLYWMARLNGGVGRRVGDLPDIVCWPGSQAEALYYSNVLGDALNDAYVDNMIACFGSVMTEPAALKSNQAAAQ